MNFVRHFAWIPAIAFGAVLAVSGPMAASVGVESAQQVQAQLAVDHLSAANPGTAESQADNITSRMELLSGGKTLAAPTLKPAVRDQLVNLQFQRNAFLAASQTWKLSYLIMGLGLLAAIMGTALLFVGWAI